MLQNPIHKTLIKIHGVNEWHVIKYDVYNDVTQLPAFLFESSIFFPCGRQSAFSPLFFSVLERFRLMKLSYLLL